MLACEDSTSIDWARVMRGAASSAKARRPLAAMAARLSVSKGLSMPTSTAPGFIRARSSALGARTFSTTSAPKASAALPMVAPAAA